MTVALIPRFADGERSRPQIGCGVPDLTFDILDGVVPYLVNAAVRYRSGSCPGVRQRWYDRKCIGRGGEGVHPVSWPWELDDGPVWDGRWHGWLRSRLDCSRLA